jgi:hypothetical protein
MTSGGHVLSIYMTLSVVKSILREWEFIYEIY